MQIYVGSQTCKFYATFKFNESTVQVKYSHKEGGHWITIIVIYKQFILIFYCKIPCYIDIRVKQNTKNKSDYSLNSLSKQYINIVVVNCKLCRDEVYPLMRVYK